MATLIEKVKKLKENDAFGVLMHPKVVQNYRLYERERKEKPLMMQSQPVGVEIEMTNRCNLACIQCLRSLGLKPYKLGNIDPDDYKRILAQFPLVMNISLNGFGEPLMYPHFFDIVAYTRKERPWAKIGIYSNGMLITDEIAERLIHSGLTELNISIDAATPETYMRVRRGGKLPVVHDNIRRLVKAKRDARARLPMLGLNFVMVNDNEGELVPFIEQAHALEVDFINCITWAGYDWGFKNRRSPESYLSELEAAQKRMDELGVRCKSFPKLDIKWTDPNRPFGCSFFWGEELRVTHEGHVTLGCCTPFKETYSYGSVLEQPFADIWNGPKFQANRAASLRHESPHRACTSCANYSKTFFHPDHGSPNLIPLSAA